MSRAYVGVLGQVRAVRDGESVHLDPLMERVLLRLVAAGGTAVPVDDLYRDAWGLNPEPRDRRNARVQVQKHIGRLRKVLGAESIVTERSSYRITLDPESCDWLEFKNLVATGDQAAKTDPAAAARLYDRALGLLPENPLPAGHENAPGQEEDAFGRAWAGQVTQLRDTALRGAVGAYRDLGDLETAVQRAERHPDEALAQAARKEARAAKDRGDLVRRAFPGLGAVLAVVTGDLFDQDDANLAIGFGDTFDTDTDQDAIISRHSVQGQLLHRVYGGNREQLDLDLEEALEAGRHPVASEDDGKTRGNLRRYMIGTAVALPLPSGGGRKVLAFAHCRQGEDFVTRSTPEDMDTALGALWTLARSQDMYRPLAMPVIGAGAARVKGLDRSGLTAKIIASFLAACRREGGPCAKELRIMVREGSLTLASRDAIRRYVHGLGPDGGEPSRPRHQQ